MNFKAERKAEAILYEKERQSIEMSFTDIYLTSTLNHLQSVMKTLHPGTWPLNTDRQIDNERYDLGVLCFVYPIWRPQRSLLRDLTQTLQYA